MTDDHSDAAAAALRRAVGSGRPRSTTAKREPSRTRRSARDPQRLQDAIDDLVTERGWSTDRAAATLAATWIEVVGPDLADHVRPESFDDGRLLLRAESTAWATQVRLLLPQVRAAIDTAVGRGVVTDISVAGPVGPTWVAGPRRVPGRGPRDTYG